MPNANLRSAQEIRAWLRRNPLMYGDAALLPNRNGRAMTRSNVVQRLDIAAARAATQHSSLAKKRISPHTIRHYLPSRIMSGNSEAGIDLGVNIYLVVYRLRKLPDIVRRL